MDIGGAREDPWKPWSWRRNLRGPSGPGHFETPDSRWTTGRAPSEGRSRRDLL